MNTKGTIKAEREAVAKHLDKIAAEHREKAVEIRRRLWRKNDSIDIRFDNWLVYMHETQAIEIDHAAFHILLGRHVEGSE
jgi:hypothetical protein